MRHLRFCRPLPPPPLLHVVPVDPRHSLYNPVFTFHSTSPTPVLLSFARTVVAFQIAYRTNLKSFFFPRKCAHGRYFFFVNIIFTKPTCIAYTVTSVFFSSFFYYLLLSPLQSTSTSTCPLRAELLNEKALYSPVYKPPVGLFCLTQKILFHSPRTCW